MDKTKQKKSLFKRMIKYGIGGLIVTTVALIAAYFYLTSEGFLKHQLLPWLGEISGSEYRVKTIDVSLWHSTIKVTGVKIGNKDHPFIVGDGSLSFSLLKIIQGNLKVDNLILDNVKVVLRQNRNGEWAIPFGSSAAEKAAQKIRRHLTSEGLDANTRIKDSTKIKVTEVASNEPFPVFLNVSNAVIKHGEFLLQTADGSQLTVADASFQLPKMFNDKLCSFKLMGKLSISAGDAMQVNANQVTLTGAIRLRPDFMMQRLNLELKMDKFNGAVNKIDLAGNKLKATVKSYWDDNGIKIEQLHIAEDRTVDDITQIAGTGMIGFSPFSIDTKIDFDPVSESFTSLALSFFRGNNPGRIKLKYHGNFHYSAGHIKSAGNFYCRRQGDALIEGTTYPLPEFSLSTIHALEIDFKHSILKVDNLEAILLQNDRQVVRLNIAPTSLGVNDVTENPLATTLIVKKLDVGLLQLLFPEYENLMPKTGQFSTKLRLSGKTFKKLRLAGDAELTDFNFMVGTKIYQNFNLHTIFDLSLNNFSKLKLNSWKTFINSEQQQFAQLTADQSDFDLKTQRGKVAFKLSEINYSTLRLLDLSKNDIAALDKLAPFELKLEGLGDIDLNKQQIVLNNFLLDIKHHSVTEMNFSLMEQALFTWNRTGAQSKKLKKIKLKISNMTPTVFNTFIKPSGFVFNHGWLNADIQFSASNFAELLNIKGKTTLYDLDLKVGTRHIRNLQFEQSIDVEIDNYRQLDIRNISGKALLRRQPLFEFEGNGRLKLAQGKGKIRLYFNCPSPLLIDCIGDNSIKKLKFNGNIGLAAENQFKTTRLNGEIKLVELFTDEMNQPLYGKTTFRLKNTPELLHCENFTLDLFSNRTPVIKLMAKASPKIIRGQHWDNIELKSSLIDLKMLEAVLTKPVDESQPKPAPRTEPFHFNLGQGRYRLHTNLGGISYGSKVKGKIISTIYGTEKNIKFAPLNIAINEGVLEIAGSLRSRPQGIQYNLVGDCHTMNISPLFNSLIIGKMKNTQTTIDKLNFRLNGNGIVGNHLWDRMQGELELQVSDISLPNTIRDTTLGNIMFLPLDGIAKFQKLTPLTMLRSSLNSNYYTDMFKTVKDFKFSSGKIKIRSQKKLIYVDKAHFVGPIIRHLQFKGFCGLGSDKRIKLKSSIDLLYLTMNLGIAGTTDYPKLELVKFIPQAIGNNVTKVLDPRNIPSLFKDFKAGWTKTVDKYPRKNQWQRRQGPTKTNSDKEQEQLERKVNDTINRLNELLK
jgi:hypothetical protein